MLYGVLLSYTSSIFNNNLEDFFLTSRGFYYIKVKTKAILYLHILVCLQSEDQCTFKCKSM